MNYLCCKGYESKLNPHGEISPFLVGKFPLFFEKRRYSTNSFLISFFDYIP